MGGFVSAGVTIPIHRPKETSVNVNAGFNKSSGNQGGGGIQGSWSHNFGNNTGSLSVNGVYNSNINKLVDNVLQSSNLNFQLPVTFRYGRDFGYMLNPNFSFTRNGNTFNAGLGFDAMNIKDPKITTNFSYNNSNEQNEQ